MSLQPEITPLGDRAWLIAWHGLNPADALACMQHAMSVLDRFPLQGQVECVPGFESVTVHLESPLAMSEEDSEAIRHHLLRKEVERELSSVLHTIPVCYDPSVGWDIEALAQQRDVDWKEIAKLHASVEYRVQCIGFSPGFPYLAGLPPPLITPRRSSPRLVVPRGSVAIGGEQTGIYTLDTPGGWHIVGKTPLRLFHPDLANPSRLKMGDRVRFEAITREELEAWDGE